MADTPKITSIIVAADTTDLPNEDRGVDNAANSYAEDALVSAFTSKPMQGMLNYSPVSKQSFERLAGTLIRQHGAGGFLHIAQFGHGGDGPRMLLGDDVMSPPELLRLLSENISQTQRPYVAIMMGGCYSGGFAKYFLTPNSNGMMPDFFFGASPPYTVNHAGLWEFYEADEKEGDYNHDGVVTLRERGIYQMNKSNSPLGVMISRRGSRDVDLNGKPASRPYFPKSVESVSDHAELLEMVDHLRFGEQVVVFVDDGSDASKEKYAWFEREAKEGDGFYKFVSIPDNPESSRFFGVTGAAAVFAMGPNLRRSGVPLNMTEPIGDQMPRVLANENTLIVMRDWKQKILKSGDTYEGIYDEVLKYLDQNPQFTLDDLVNEGCRLITVKDVSLQLKGLHLLKAIIQADGVNHDKIYQALHALSEKLVADNSAPDKQVIIALIDTLDALKSEDAEHDRAKVFEAGLKLYPSLENDLAAPEEFARQRRNAHRLRWKAQFDYTQSFIGGRAQDDWIGGIAFSGALRLQKGLFIDREEEHIVAMGIESGLAVSPIWKHGWVQFMPTVELTLDFQTEKETGGENNLPSATSWGLSGGYAGRYAHGENGWDYVHGWTAAVNYLFQDSMNYNKETHEFASELLAGPFVRGFYFPAERGYLITAGVEGRL